MDIWDVLQMSLRLWTGSVQDAGVYYRNVYYILTTLYHSWHR